MKKILFTLFLILAFEGIYAQISLTGDAYYKFKIDAYYGDPSDCGSIEGLKNIFVKYSDGTTNTLFDGTAKNRKINYDLTYTKSNPIVYLEIHKLQRSKNDWGDCTKSKNHYNKLNYTSTCHFKFDADAGYYLNDLIVASSPFVAINGSASPLSLGNNEILNINLPNALDNNHFNWKFKVGNGAEQSIPAAFNNVNSLNLRGDQFLTPADFGKTITIWVEMGCDTGIQIAQGFAKAKAITDAEAQIVEMKKPEIKQCKKLSLFRELKCLADLEKKYAPIQKELETTLYNQYLAELLPTYQSLSLRSNAISFTYRSTAPTIVKTTTTVPTCFDSNDGSVKVVFDRNLMPSEFFGALRLVSVKTGVPLYTPEVTSLTQEADGSGFSYTFNNVPADNYSINMTVAINGTPSFTDGANHKATVTVLKNTPVIFQDRPQNNATNVLCFDGSNGSIQLNAAGGVGGYSYLFRNKNQTWNDVSWQSFSSANSHNITGLRADNYFIRIKDRNDCTAKVQVNVNGEIKLGNEIIEEVILTQPQPLIINYIPENSSNPTAKGFTNGKIQAVILGGTMLNNRYNYTWKDASGNILNTITEEVITSSTGEPNLVITLNTIGAGNYYLSVSDANSCVITNSPYTLSEPAQLTLTTEITSQILCNTITASLNTPSYGAITAHASGGVPLSASANRGLPYYYTWKKKNANANWEIFQEPSIANSTITDLSSGEYALNIEDANGITIGDYSANVLVVAKDATVFLTEPSPIVIETNKTDVSCFNGNNGSIINNVTGGTGIYTIQWKDDSSVSALNRYDLSAGNYTLTIIDQNNCKAETTITIHEPNSSLAVNYPSNFEKPTASGFSNGSLIARISGGTPKNDQTYGYIWMDEKNNNYNIKVAEEFDTDTDEWVLTLKNIPAGSYNLLVFDANDCSFQKTFILNEPSPLKLTLDLTTTINCFGDSNAEITAYASGGVPSEFGAPYTFIWKKKNTDGSWKILDQFEDNKADGLEAGTYAVNITDSLGIVIGEYANNLLVKALDIIIKVSQPEVLSITNTKKDVNCFNGNDGFIAIATKGGTAPFTVTWNDNLTISTLNRSNLTKGIYTFSVTDANGCSVKDAVTINQPTKELGLTFPSELKKPTASGLTNGSLTASITGATPNQSKTYTYVWTNANGDNFNNRVTEKFNADTNEFVLTLKNIPAGKYNLVVSDANNCSAEKTFILNEPGPLKLSLDLTKPINCFGGSSAEITARASGGVPFEQGNPYIFVWKKKNTDGSWKIIDQFENDKANGLTAGTYAVNITDASGIIVGEYVNNLLVKALDVVLTITQPKVLNVTNSKKDVSCFNGNDGFIKLAVTGGTAPFSVIWEDDTLADFNRNNIAAGRYTFSVTDKNGCTFTDAVTVNQPAKEISVVYSTYNLPSPNTPNGWIEATISGGTPNNDNTYTYVWEDVNGKILNVQTEIIAAENNNFRIKLKNIASGNYYLTITDKNFLKTPTLTNCSVSRSLFTLNNLIEAVIEEFIPISCSQQNTHNNPYGDGALIAHVKGGFPFTDGQPYIYHWKKLNLKGEWEDIANQHSDLLTDISAGQYALNVEDSKGNTTNVSLKVNEPELITLTCNTTAVSCFSGNNGTANVTITGGVPPYSIIWSNGSQSSEIKNLISGNHRVLVTDSRGCMATHLAEVGQESSIAIIPTTKKDPTCINSSDGEIEITVTGGQAPYSYLWDTGEKTNTLKNIRSGIYKIQVTDNLNCISYAEIVLIEPNPILIELGENKTICKNQTYPLNIKIDDALARYKWESENGFNSTSSSVELKKQGTYVATITNSKGCIVTDTIIITVIDAVVDAHFLLTSKAYTQQEIILVNVSQPMGEKTVWKVPAEAKIISQTADQLSFEFEKEGAYEIQLRSYQGDCFEDYHKTIIVEKNMVSPLSEDEKIKFIEELLVYPNPSNGNFKLKLALAEKSPISIKIIDLVTTHVVYTKQEDNSDQYLLDMNVNIASGIYLLTVETPRGSAIRKLVIE